ncbi:MAG: hypothetical protein ACKO2P_10650 [Planctomycetota bacterium]
MGSSPTSGNLCVVVVASWFGSQHKIVTMPPELADNPFAAPQMDPDPLPVLAPDDPADFILQGDIVICGPLLILPGVCWKSGSTEDLIPVQFQIDQASFRFDSRPVDVLGYLSKSRRQQDTWRAVRLWLLLLTGLVLFSSPSLLRPQTPGLSLAPLSPTLVITGIAMICKAAVFFVRGRPVVRHYRPPNLHYVQGFTPELLSQLQARQSAQRPHRDVRDVARDA